MSQQRLWPQRTMADSGQKSGMNYREAKSAQTGIVPLARRSSTKLRFDLPMSSRPFPGESRSSVPTRPALIVRNCWLFDKLS